MLGTQVHSLQPMPERNLISLNILLEVELLYDSLMQYRLVEIIHC